MLNTYMNTVLRNRYSLRSVHVINYMYECMYVWSKIKQEYGSSGFMPGINDIHERFVTVLPGRCGLDAFQIFGGTASMLVYY